MNNDQIISEVRNESMLNKKQDPIITIDDTIIKKYINIKKHKLFNKMIHLKAFYKIKLRHKTLSHI